MVINLNVLFLEVFIKNFKNAQNICGTIKCKCQFFPVNFVVFLRLWWQHNSRSFSYSNFLGEIKLLFSPSTYQFTRRKSLCLCAWPTSRPVTDSYREAQLPHELSYWGELNLLTTFIVGLLR